MRQPHRRVIVAVVVALLIAGLPALSVSAIAPQSSSFERTWQRTDQPVANQSATRTWMWGPGGFTSTMWEWYDDAPGGARIVQYFDKSRMEDNSYRAPDAPWDVSNGLLVNELVSGQMQMGDARFESRAPADVNVAGDPDDPNGPTYQTMGTVLDADPMPEEAFITARIDRAGNVTPFDQSAYDYQMKSATYVPETDHTVAWPFWTFMTSSGQVYENGQYSHAPLFQNPFYATGYPITEAYWANVRVGGEQRDVLIQCFERRCLTFTPTNPFDWRVEMGNVGQHYYTWRYGVPIPTEPPAINSENFDRLPPAPLAEWPFEQGGESLIVLQNDSPHTMQVIFDGPAHHTMSIPANPDGIIWPDSASYPGCDADGPLGEVVLPAGNYRVQLNFPGGNVDPSRGYWTIVPDSAYSGCYFVVADDLDEPPSPPPDVTTFGTGPSSSVRTVPLERIGTATLVTRVTGND